MMTDPYATILRKTDSFVLDATVQNLENISPNCNYPLPLGAAHPSGNTDEDRPYLQTPFNKVDKKTYRSPWKAAAATASGSETEILELESTANEVWDAYRQLYYGHDAIGSVFVRRKGADARTGTPSKSKKGGALEALFGIQKKCVGQNGTDEIARWDSVHTVTIEVPNFDEATCEYKIQSAVWCRYKPEDVGDVPKAERPKRTPPKKKKFSSPRKKPNSKLDVARLEIFDKAANDWDNKSSHGKQEVANAAAAAAVAKSGTPLPPVPAVVTSSAVYTKDTAKVCKLQLTKKQAKGGSIPISSHIQNIGTLLEKIEADFRSKLERVDAPKCVEVLQSMYRPSLSPGLKLGSKTNNSMVSKLGGHATGMGVGKGLIGEIALKAKSKGLGSEEFGTSSSPNKAMENILANEKKKLKDNVETPKAPSTWNQTSLKKSKVSPNNNKDKAPAAIAGSGSFEKPSLRKTKSGSASKQVAEATGGGAGFLRRSKLRKAVSVRQFEPSTPAPTPEFMNFRSKLKSTAAK